MAGRADIEAGHAFVKLSMQDASFIRSLAKNSARLKAFGDGLSAIGTTLMKAGASILAPLAAAVTHFVKVGDALGDMADRTGIAASALAEFQYAAERSETDIDTLEKAIRKMALAIQELREGGKGAVKLFRELGLTAQDFVGKSLDQQLDTIAQRLRGVADVNKRMSIAQQIFGKTGASLLPLIENLERLRTEARREGLIPSDQAVKAAGEIDDAFKKLRSGVSAAVFEIGFAFAPAVEELVYDIRMVVKSAKNWVQENRELIRGAGQLGAGLTPGPTCDCRARADQMDLWGAEGCRTNRDQIIQWMREGQTRWGWKDKLAAAANAVKSGLAFKLNPLDPYPSLVDEAIRRAEEKQQGKDAA